MAMLEKYMGKKWRQTGEQKKGGGLVDRFIGTSVNHGSLDKNVFVRE